MSISQYTFDPVPDWGSMVALAPKTVLGPMTKLVLLVLYQYASKMGPVVWTAAPVLAEMTSLELKDVQKAMVLAQKAGYIKRVRMTDKFGKWNGWKYVAGYPSGAPHPLEIIQTGEAVHYKAVTWEEVEELVDGITRET